jgi:8-oxo-dGTP pyrophosphatase MutT (NUDIX family)
VLRQAGVLVALIEETGAILLTKRASRLKHHPGQIAFPGGKVDPSDEGPVAAALREAEEEVGLPKGGAEVLGTLPVHETVTGFAVTPVLARVARAFPARPEAGEVEEVFSVPLSHLAERANYLVQERLWQGHNRRYFAVPYGPYYIWGATARILRGLAERLSP